MDKCQKRQKRITIFIFSLSGGGAERVGCNLANYLCRNRYHVDVITMTDKNDTYVLNDCVNRICLLPEKERKNKIYNLLLKRKRLKDYIKNNPDVACYVAFLPTNCFLLTRMRKWVSRRIIISERNNPSSYGLLERFMMKYSAKRCDGLVVQTETIGEWYKGIKNKIVIPNAINEDIVLSKCKTPTKKIVAVGRLNKQKNYPMLIEAFQIFNEKHPDYKLEIYGIGSEEEQIKKLVEKKNLGRNVKFMGYVKDVSAKISDAACFAMTSNYEGMPNALIEAMCIGVPCVATDCDGGGARELITNGINGILVAKGDAVKFASGISEIIDNNTLSHGLSKNAIKLREKLSPNLVYGKWLRFIEEGIE